MNFGNAVGDGIFGKDFYGISESNLNNVKSVILNYQKEVQNNLNNLCQEVNAGVVSGAVKGEELTSSIQAFVDAVKNEAIEWSTNINRYCEAIDEVIAQYKGVQTQSASTLQSNKTNVSKGTDTYTYDGSGGNAASAS